MPTPAELPMPPGDPEALADLVQDVSGAAYWLTVLVQRLSGPAADAPGWLGDDAAAAASQVGRVATLTRDAANAVLEATGRLSSHAGCLREARREVTRLRQEQDEDFRAAWRRLGQIENPQLAVMTDSPAWVGVIEDVEATEASRRRRHAALVEEVEDDAAATARVLAQASGVVGGTGARGDAGRVTAYLAAELPGWGDLELSRLACQLVPHLMKGNPEELEAAAREALAYADSPVFADALLATLGVTGVRELLTSIGSNSFEGREDMPRLLATAFGRATTGGRAAAVLGATYVDAGDEEYGDDAVVAGMVGVLGASRSVASGGLPTATVGSWARQFLLWENEPHKPAGAIPLGWAPELYDPSALALEILADRADPAASAELFGDVRVWQTALGRTWPDDGVALREVIAQAGQAPGVAGARSVRNGLVVLGGGLFEGDPSDWTVNRLTAEAVTPALALGVAAHADVVAPALAASADGHLPAYSRDLLRGLGIVTTYRPGAVLIGVALDSWTAAQQPPVDAGVAPFRVTVTTAYLAAQEYGQRLDFALDEDLKQEAAETRKWFWDHTIGLVPALLRNPFVSEGVDLGLSYAQIWVDADGTWDEGVDHGLVFTQEDAVNAAKVAMFPDLTALAPVGDTADVLLQGLRSFDGAISVLDPPEAPESPPENWSAPVRELLGDLSGVAVDHAVDRAGAAGPHK